MLERKIGPDLFRVLCCFGVILYHTFDDIILFIPYQFTGDIFVYFLASFCVTGFFMLSGYLYGKKQSATLAYSVNKVLNTIIKYSFWLILARFLRRFYTGSILPFKTDFVFGFMAKGALPVAWFLFTYIVIMLYAPLLHRLFNKNVRLFFLLTAVLFVFSGFQNRFGVLQQQQFWFPLYTAYFMSGMLISKCNLEKLSIRHKRLLAAVNVFFLRLYYYKVFFAEYLRLPNSHYFEYYYIIWVISLFILICSTDLKSQLMRKIIRSFAGATFTVYMLHLPVLLIFTTHYPLRSFLFTSLISLLLFLFCGLIGIIMKRIPFFRYFA